MNDNQSLRELKFVCDSSEYLHSGPEVVFWNKGHPSGKVIVYFHRSLFGALGENERSMFEVLTDVHRKLFDGAAPFWMNSSDDEIYIELMKDCSDTRKSFFKRASLNRMSDDAVGETVRKYANEVLFTLQPKAKPLEPEVTQVSDERGPKRFSVCKSIKRLLRLTP